MKKYILIILIFSLSVSSLVAQENNITSKHVVSIDTQPLISGLIVAPIMGSFLGLGYALSGSDFDSSSIPFGYGIGLGYEYIINSHVTVGVDTDFVGVHVFNENIFMFNWNINSKFFFKKTGTPKGFFMKPMIGGTYGNASDNSSIYLTTAQLELGWRFLLSPETAKTKFAIDFSPFIFGYSYDHSKYVEGNKRNNFTYGSFTLAFTVIF